MDEVQIFPAKHDVTTGDRIKKPLPELGLILMRELNSCKKMGKNLEAERIKTRTEYDIEIMLETGYCTGIENYTLFEFARAGCSAGYFD